MKTNINYTPYNREIIFNDGTWIFDKENKLVKQIDPGISPIIKVLPPAPQLNTIAGYGLKPSEQYWEALRPKMPDKLLEIVEDTDMSREDKIKLLDNNPEYYADEITFIENELKYLREGFWFFNKGQPCNLTHDNYFYLQYWWIDGKHPYFCYRDHEWFWSVKIFGEDDVLTYGTNHFKERRIGDSNKAQACGLRRTLCVPYHKTSMQSKDEDHASQIFELMTMVNWDKIPFYLQPIWNLDYQNKSSIKCFSPRARKHPNYKKKALESIMTFTNSNITALDGTKQNLIIDEEIGKAPDLSVYERHYIQIPCLKQGGAKRGFKICVSTVEEMVSGGGMNAFKLAEESHYNPPLKRSQLYPKEKVSQGTLSGLVNIFIPCNEGLYLEEIDPKTKEITRKSIDKYGIIDLKWTTTYILGEYAKEKNGNQEKYLAYLKKYPMFWEDCWRIIVEGCHFNVKILNQRRDELSFMQPAPYRKGNFRWKDGIPDSTVEWADDNDNGRWVLSKMLSNKESNAFSIMGNKKTPDNWWRFVMGCDPYKYGKKAGSDGGIAVFMKRDIGLDHKDKETKDFKTFNWVCTYSWRHRDLEQYAEDALMTAVYFGCKMAEETNFTYVNNYFERRGYGNYLHYFRTDDGMERDVAGQDTQAKQKMEYFRFLDDFINKHGLRINHPEIIDDCLNLQDDFQPFDRLVACSLALKAAMQEENFNVFRPSEIKKDELMERYYAGIELDSNFQPIYPN